MRKGAWSLLAAFVLAAAAGLAQASPPDGPLRIAVPADHFGIAQVVRAAEAGNARAQTRLGFMHEHGRGVAQDYSMAAMWYRRAAEQGEPNAQHLLGLLYDKGFGVPIDVIEAHKWLNLAAGRAAPGNRDYFTRMRNSVASKMNTGEIAVAQGRARRWFPKREW
jgi:TPR repeat protein